jgi:DNA-damage-inducible protein J
MPANAVVRARIDAKTKAEAAAVLATIGLTVSDVFRLLMLRVAQDKAMPFEPLIPNAETIAAMEESMRGELTRVGKISELIAQLNADD